MFTDLSHRVFLFALCSFIMCTCFATCYLAQNRAEIFLDFAPAPTPFPEVPYKSSIRGREQRYLRPRVALPAAASSTNSGREQTTSPYRTKDASRPWPNAAIPTLFPLSTTLPQPLFFCHHHLQPTKRKINFKKNDKLLPEINN